MKQKMNNFKIGQVSIGRGHKPFIIAEMSGNHNQSLERALEIVEAAAKIKLNKQKKLYLGNLYAKRDWGYAKEYVEAMWKMLQQKKPNDYVVSTGKTHSIKDFINKATKYLKMNVIWRGKGLNERLINKDDNKTLIKINPKYFRPSEVNILIGNSNKAMKKLNWKPKTSFEELAIMMYESDYSAFSRSATNEKRYIDMEVRNEIV